MSPKEALENLRLEFKSDNSTPTDWTMILSEEYEAITAYINDLENILALLLDGDYINDCSLDKQVEILLGRRLLNE